MDIWSLRNVLSFPRFLIILIIICDQDILGVRHMFSVPIGIWKSEVRILHSNTENSARKGVLKNTINGLPGASLPFTALGKTERSKRTVYSFLRSLQ